MALKQPPNHRYVAVKAALGAGAFTQLEPAEVALFELLSNRPCVSAAVEYAYELYADATHREIVDAFVLSRAQVDLSSKALEIPIDVLQVYAHLFMDMGVFRNKLEVLSFSQAYNGSAYGKELVKAAVTVGPTYLLWTYGGADEMVDTRYIVRHTMLDAYFRGLAHKGNALTSAIAKEAQKWTQTAIRNAEILERIDPRTTKEAHEELKMALEAEDTTLRTEQSPVPVADILRN